MKKNFNYLYLLSETERKILENTEVSLSDKFEDDFKLIKQSLTDWQNRLVVNDSDLKEYQKLENLITFVVTLKLKLDKAMEDVAYALQISKNVIKQSLEKL